MLLTYESRHVGDIAVVTCRGSFADGRELAALHRYADDLLQETVHIVADLGAVEYIDSSGVGSLVRLHTKARRAGGDLKLCALPTRIAEVLRLTHLLSIFGTYGTQAEAIAACYDARPSLQSLAVSETNVLCVDGSPDVLAYLRELLKGAGYGVLTVTNMADAVVLSTATRPRLVVISAALGSTSGARALSNSDGGARRPVVIELPPEFSRLEAGHAARDLLEKVRSAMAAS